jgi:hypothetical protein
MDRETDFSNNFRKAIAAIVKDSTFTGFGNVRFKLTPVKESEMLKKSQSDSLFYRKSIRKNIDFEHTLFGFEETLEIFNLGINAFPLWAEIEQIKNSGGLKFEIRFSLRFRKYEELNNQEYGFPPFKTI